MSLIPITLQTASQATWPPAVTSEGCRFPISLSASPHGRSQICRTQNQTHHVKYRKTMVCSADFTLFLQDVSSKQLQQRSNLLGYFFTFRSLSEVYPKNSIPPPPFFLNLIYLFLSWIYKLFLSFQTLDMIYFNFSPTSSYKIHLKYILICLMFILIAKQRH